MENRVKQFRINKALEFCSNELYEFYQNECITHNRMMQHIPQHNGMVEE